MQLLIDGYRSMMMKAMLVEYMSLWEISSLSLKIRKLLLLFRETHLEESRCRENHQGLIRLLPNSRERDLSTDIILMVPKLNLQIIHWLTARDVSNASSSRSLSKILSRLCKICLLAMVPLQLIATYPTKKLPLTCQLSRVLWVTILTWTSASTWRIPLI